MCGQWSLEFLVFEPNRAVNWPVTSIGNMVLHFWLYDFFFAYKRVPWHATEESVLVA